MNQAAEPTSKILIVDDIPKNLQILGNILLTYHYNIAYAKTGEEALKLVQSSEFDLILLDIMMPGMDGYMVCEHLRMYPPTQDVPIIFLTAKTEPEHVVRGFELGAQDYITKPFHPKELIARVKTQLELKHKREQLSYMNTYLESLVAERTQELQIANEKLSRLEQAKSDFLGIISHELKTPLNGVKGFADLLEEQLQHTPYYEDIFLLKKSADRLVKFSEIALLVTNLRADTYEVKQEELKIASLLDAAIQDVKSLAESKNILIKRELNPPDVTCLVDSRLLITGFVIILENAIKYSEADKTVVIHASESKDELKIAFKDQGQGFSEKELGHVFDSFTSSDILHHTGGAGLGLTAAKLIVELHQGSIHIENNTTEGATVLLTLKKRHL